MTLFSSFKRDETDEQLMERFVFRDNEKAFEELYCRYAPPLQRFLYTDAVGGRSIGRRFPARVVSPDL
ncbi:hypothetical protein NXX71_20020 [Bacteroides faecis]|nr:hypothetical protein [Bacteroides faecis]